METKEIKVKHKQMFTDCTYGCDVILCGDYTAWEFIAEILERDEFKEGCINIISEKYNPSMCHLSECWKIYYKEHDITEGKLMSKQFVHDMVAILTSHVVEANALDAWNGKFDFNIMI